MQGACVLAKWAPPADQADRVLPVANVAAISDLGQRTLEWAIFVRSSELQAYRATAPGAEGNEW
jgi:hypothetical protein